MGSSGVGGDAESVRLRIAQDGRVLLAEADLFQGTREDLMHYIKVLASSDEPRLLVTPNVDQVINLHDSAAFRRSFQSAALRLIDGTPLYWLARVMGAKMALKLSGSDLVGVCASVAKENSWRILLIGGNEQICQSAVRRLQGEFDHGSDTFSAISMPIFSEPEDPVSEDVVNRIREARPSITFICLGSPKQELWFDEWARDLPCGLYIGAGATLEFVAGFRRRAPASLSVSGFEWLWRLVQEPRRLWRRYLIKGPRFVPFAFRSALGRRRK
jgi:exopolysaccharide biosynthesis WecB/TagA/CpsF family protein